MSVYVKGIAIILLHVLDEITGSWTAAMPTPISGQNNNMGAFET